MSGNFKDHFGLGDQDEDESIYRAWRTCQQGSTMYLKLVPAKGSDESTWYVPYLQAISIELDPNGGRLCLLCHTSSMSIFIEGTELEELAQQISEKRAKSVHVFAPSNHTHAEGVTSTVTKIIVDKS